MEFNQLVKEYQEPLYWHIRRLVVCHEDARDILQDTLLQAWRSIKSLRNEKSLKAWLYKIATNNSYRHLSRNSEQPLSTEELSSVLLNRLESSSYVDYEDGAVVKFQQAILSLTEHQRTLFNLRYYDEMSYDEIAEIMGTSAASLRVSYHNACNNIRSYIENN